IAKLQRWLKIEAASFAPQAMRGAAHRFGRYVHGEPGASGFAATVDHGEADTRTGDRGADRNGGRVVRAGDGDTQVAALLHACDRADGGDDTGEHAASLALPRVDFERV